MEPHEHRVALNETAFRAVNERIGEVTSKIYLDPEGEFICECGDGDCTERVTLRLDEYEAVRAAPNRFFVKCGHDDPRAERVVAASADYSVVEKFGEAGAIAVERDPR